MSRSAESVTRLALVADEVEQEDFWTFFQTFQYEKRFSAGYSDESESAIPPIGKCELAAALFRTKRERSGAEDAESKERDRER